MRTKPDLCGRSPTTGRTSWVVPRSRAACTRTSGNPRSACESERLILDSCRTGADHAWVVHPDHGGTNSRRRQNWIRTPQGIARTAATRTSTAGPTLQLNYGSPGCRGVRGSSRALDNYDGVRCDMSARLPDLRAHIWASEPDPF